MKTKVGVELLKNIIKYCKANNISLMSNDKEARIHHIEPDDEITIEVIGGFLTINSVLWFSPVFTLSKKVVKTVTSNTEFLLELNDIISFISFKDDDILNTFK